MIRQRAMLLLLIPVFLSSCVSLPKGLNGLEPGTRQVLIVRSSGPEAFKATLSAWARVRNGWRRVFGPWPAVIGRNGFAPTGEKREGDGRTPSGTFPLEMAFGRGSTVRTGLAYEQMGPADFWVDDVHSPQYNHLVRGTPAASSFETMLRPDGLYDFGVVIGYNTRPVVSGMGSAIFLHIWRDRGAKPTAGCVALEKKRLRRLIQWLDADYGPVVVLGK